MFYVYFVLAVNNCELQSYVIKFWKKPYDESQINKL